MRPLTQSLSIAFVVATLVPFVACGSDHVDAVAVNDAAADVVEASVADAGTDGPFPILPYPAGPYGGGVGDVIPNFTVKGYALSRQQHDSSRLPFRPISLAEVRSTPGCECLAIVITGAGTQCGPCVNYDRDLTHLLSQNPSACAFELVQQNYDGADPDAGQNAPQPPTRADLDAFTQAGRENYPVALMNVDSSRAVSDGVLGAIPMTFVVRAQDMRIAGLVTGSGAAPEVLPTCKRTQPVVETLATGVAPRDIAVDDADVYVADSSGILRSALPHGAPAVIAAAPPAPDRIALTSSRVVWASSSGPPPYAIGHVGKDGSAPTILQSDHHAYTSVAADETTAFFTRDDGFVGAIPLAGGNVVVLDTSESSAASIVVDGTYAYWIAGARVVRAPKAGGPKQVLVEEGALFLGHPPVAIALGPTSDSDLYVGLDFFVMRMPRAGGALARVINFPGTSMALDEKSVLTLAVRPPDGSQGAIVTPLKDGFDIQTPGQAHVGRLASRGGFLYWTIEPSAPSLRDGSIRRIAR